MTPRPPTGDEAQPDDRPTTESHQGDTPTEVIAAASAPEPGAPHDLASDPYSATGPDGPATELITEVDAGPAAEVIGRPSADTRRATPTRTSILAAASPAPAQPAASLPAAPPAGARTAPGAASGTAGGATTSAGSDFVSVSPAVRHAPRPATGRATASEYEGHKRRKAPWIIAAVVVLLVGGYATVAWLISDKVPAHTTVAGVEIGGLTRAQATTKLQDTIGARATSPIAVTVAGTPLSLDPKASGLSFDAAATVAPLVGFSLSPTHVLDHFTGAHDITPQTSQDDKALSAQVQALADSTNTDPIEGAITIADGKAQVTQAQAGSALDVPGSVAIVDKQWLTGKQPIDLPVTSVEPTIGQAQVDAAMTGIIDVVNSGPVTVTFDGGVSVELPSEAIMAAASVTPNGDKLELSLNPDALYQQLQTRMPAGIETGATDAKFVFDGGAPVIQPGTPGRKVDTAALATAVNTAALSPNNRSTAATLVDVQPEQDVAALEALGIKEVVGQFSTNLISERVRNTNIAQGAKIITGVLVKPGETFSLTQALGPIDAAHGFVEAGVLSKGQHTEGMGGGLSQLSTTLYNAQHLAGMVDVTHQPHSVWFTRYPAGREATLWAGQIDQKFTNDTPYGVLIQAWIDPGKYTTNVALWSTHYWDVESSIGPKTNVVPATMVHMPASPTCENQSAGNSGFTVTVTRTKSLNGQVKDTQNWKWTYKPDNGYICDAPPAPAADAGGEQPPPD